MSNITNNMVMMRNSAFDESTLNLATGTTEITGLELSNTQLYSNSEIFRTPTLINAQLNMFFSEISFVSGLVLWRHNLSATATLQWRGYASSDLSGTPVFDSGVVNAIDIKNLGEMNFGIEPLGANIYDNSAFTSRFTELWLKNNNEQFEPVAVQSQSIVINDPDNLDGYIDLTRIYNGLAQSPKVNFSYGAKLSFEATSENGVLTADGSYHTIKSPVVRNTELNLNWITEIERSAFIEFFALTGIHQDFYISLYPNERGQKRRDNAFAAKCKSIPSSTHNFYNNYLLPLQVREV